LDTPSFSLSPQKQIAHPDPVSLIQVEEEKEKEEQEDRLAPPKPQPKPKQSREEKKSDDSLSEQSHQVNISIVDYTIGSISNFSAFELDPEKRPGDSLLRGDTFGTSQLKYEKPTITELSFEDEIGFGKKDTKIEKLSIQNSITDMAKQGSKHKKAKQDKNSGGVCAKCLVI